MLLVDMYAEDRKILQVIPLIQPLREVPYMQPQLEHIGMVVFGLTPHLQMFLFL